MVRCVRDWFSHNVWICTRTREAKLAVLNGSTLAKLNAQLRRSVVALAQASHRRPSISG